MCVHFRGCKWCIKSLWSVKCASLFSPSHHYFTLYVHSTFVVYMVNYEGANNPRHALRAWSDMSAPFLTCPVPLHTNMQMQSKCHGRIANIQLKSRLADRAGLILQRVSMLYGFIPVLNISDWTNGGLWIYNEWWGSGDCWNVVLRI